jgi:tRNA(fMet)-specific endonuclease VapC
VYSYLMKPDDSRAKIYRPHVQGKLIAVSFVTVGELLFGASKKKWGKQRLDDLNQRLRSVVIVPYDLRICMTYADLKARLQESGKCVADNDLWIAACAVRHSIPLVSNNRAHFEVIPGLALISEAKVIRDIRSQISLDENTEPKKKS